MLRDENYDVSRMSDGYDPLIDALNLDALIIDTHPGLNDETLLTMAVSDRVGLILRPDYQDYQGTSVALELRYQDAFEFSHICWCCNFRYVAYS